VLFSIATFLLRKYTKVWEIIVGWGRPDIVDKWYLNDVIVPEGVIRIVK
jgi:hypothetical protein